jgi:hypothetical protein
MSRPPRADKSSTPAASVTIPIQPSRFRCSPTSAALTIAVINGAEPRAIG